MAIPSSGAPSEWWLARQGARDCAGFIEFHLFVQEKGSLFQSSLRGVLAPCATRRTQCPLVGGVAWAFVPVFPVPPSSPCPLELSVPRRGGCGVCWGLLDLGEGRGGIWAKQSPPGSLRTGAQQAGTQTLCRLLGVAR